MQDRVSSQWLRVWVLLFFAFPLQASDESARFLIGHNFTPTSYTLSRGQFTVGNYALGYGITDHWTLATSPWMIVSYNMPMIQSKFAFETDTFFQRVSLDLNYFKTMPYGRNLFQQESTFTRLTATHRFAGFYTAHLCASHQYFIDDTAPFSLHLYTGNGTKHALGLTSLHEFHLTEWFGFFVELGFVGLNYSVPWFQSGVSAFISTSWGLVQFGLSKTNSTSPVVNNYTFNRQTLAVDSEKVSLTYIHPEMQVQILF